MNKLIIVCGGDRLGKGTLIKGLCKHYDYKNITIRHCDKPPKNVPKEEILDYQFNCFEQEFNLINYIQSMHRKYMYHDNIIIYDRFYLGEFVYGQMFRNFNRNLIKNKILELEKKNIKLLQNITNIYLITLTADPEFFMSKEDGKSFSRTLKDKTIELKLFHEAMEFSCINNKLFVRVEEDGKFRPKENIINQVIKFIDSNDNS